MDLDTAKSVAGDGAVDQVEDAAGVATGVDESEADQAARVAGDDPRDFGVGGRVIAVERAENDRAVDTRLARAAKVGLDGRVGIPGGRHAVAIAGVTVAIDDHGYGLACSLTDWPRAAGKPLPHSRRK